jgi:hypothetical protein
MYLAFESAASVQETIVQMQANKTKRMGRNVKVLGAQM